MLHHMFSIFRASQRAISTELPANPLAHPAISRMSERELGDLPLSQNLQAAYCCAAPHPRHKTIQTELCHTPCQTR